MGQCATQAGHNRRNHNRNAAGGTGTGTGGNSNTAETGGTNNGDTAAGNNAGGSASPGSRSNNNRRDRSVRQAPMVKSLIFVENDQIKLTKEGATYTLKIAFSTDAPGFEIAAMFNANVSDPQNHNAIPVVNCPSKSEFKKTVQSEQSVTLTGIQPSMLQVLKSAEDSVELPNELPLVIHFKSLTEGYSSKVVNALWLYCNLKKNEENYDVLVLKKVIARSGRSYLLQTLFGGTVTVPGTEGDGQECVVCLSAPRQVAVLHCKHVCLCKDCASVTSSTWSYQCPICRGRVAAFVAVTDEEPPP